VTTRLDEHRAEFRKLPDYSLHQQLNMFYLLNFEGAVLWGCRMNDLIEITKEELRRRAESANGTAQTEDLPRSEI
jgi:hypothetical protein